MPTVACTVWMITSGSTEQLVRGHAGLLGEQKSAEQRQGCNTVKALDEAHLYLRRFAKTGAGLAWDSRQLIPTAPVSLGLGRLRDQLLNPLRPRVATLPESLNLGADH